MPPFEYLLLLASVILGLAACELAIGCNRLFSVRQQIRWDWLSPLAAVLVFLKLVTQWWAWHDAVSIASGITFEMYLAVLVGAVLLFMMAAAALPSGEVSGDVLDLRVYYATTSRRFWILFTLHFLVAVGTSIWMQAALEHARLPLASPAYLIIPVGVSLTLTRNRLWHTAALVTLCAVYFLQYLGHSLSG